MLTFFCDGCGVTVLRKQRRKGNKHVFCSTLCRNKNLTGARPVADRLWEKVEKSDGCWIWTGALMSNGYGSINRDGSRQRTVPHRVAWELTNGPIPSGLFVCHKCDVPRCCNPAHLFLGTAKDNAQDMVSKGRGRTPNLRGEANATSLLTDDLVRQIRARRASGDTLAVIAADFGVHLATVSQVANRKTWAHVA